jgi:hypothetical protein
MEGYNLNRKIAYSLALLTMLLVLSVVTNPTNAITFTPGVKAGSTADYKVLGNPALTYNRTHITVWGTTGSYVALTATNYRPNGAIDSVVAHNYSISSYGGSSFLDAVFYWVVGANLTKGPDEILSAFPGVFVVNNLTMTAAGVSRFVLHANGSGIYVTYFDMYFDRATGLVIQGNYATGVGWINVTLVSTNVWSQPAPAESPFSTTSIIAIAGVGIVALVVGLLVGRSGKRKK